MYETFFGLHARPFPSIPAAEFYFPADVIEQARSTLVRVIDRAEGAGLVIGPAGTGKSLLCQLIAEQFRHEFSIAMLSSTRLCSRRALLQNILFELKLPYRGLEEGELRLSLIDYLEPSERCPNGMLLMIDEAHTLPLRLLEEVRMITNLVRAGQPRVRLILAGNSQLEERLASPKLESFQQRLAARCYVHSLNQTDTTNYVRHHMALVGSSADRIFSPEAYKAIFDATDGIPRLVNQVCDHALILACAGGTQQITDLGIEEAWSDLQRLPAPWVASAPSEDHSDSIVEFSVLDEDAETASHRVTDGDEVAAGNDPPSLEHQGWELAELEINPSGDLEFAEPEVPRAEDPFGGPFADEELILERFADWRLLPRVSTADQRFRTAAVDQAVDSADQEQSFEESIHADDQFADEQFADEQIADEQIGDEQIVDDQFIHDQIVDDRIDAEPPGSMTSKELLELPQVQHKLTESRQQTAEASPRAPSPMAHDSTASRQAESQQVELQQPESQHDESQQTESQQDESQHAVMNDSERAPHGTDEERTFVRERVDRTLAQSQPRDGHEEQLAMSVEELRETAKSATAHPSRAIPPAVAELLAIWSQPVFAGSFGESEQDCWTSDVLPTSSANSPRLLNQLRRV